VRLLIDTNVFLWAAGVERGLTARDKELIRASDTIFLSAVSAWEISIKWAKGRLTLPAPPEKMIESLINVGGLERLPIRFEDTYAVTQLPEIKDHRDPFDRLLVAQAKRIGLPLMTSDDRLADYGVELIVCNPN